MYELAGGCPFTSWTLSNLIQKIMNTNSLYGLVPRRNYLRQKILNTNSFHGYVRIHEVRYFYVKYPASSCIKLRLLMYELTGKRPSTSLILGMSKKKLSHTENYKY